MHAWGPIKCAPQETRAGSPARVEMHDHSTVRRRIHSRECISLSVVGVSRVVSFRLLGDEGCGRCNHAVPASRAQVWKGLSCAFCLALKQFITATDCVSGTGDLMNDCLLLIQSTHQMGTSGAEHPQIARADPSHAALVCSHMPTLSPHPYGLCWPDAHY